MRQIREFRSNFENISHDCRAIVARLSHDSRATFVRVSHDFPANLSYFHFNSYDSRATFVRVSHDIRTNVAKAPISLECDNWRLVRDYFATKINEINTTFTLQSH